MKDEPFAEWEARMGLRSLRETARVLGISHQAVSRLRSGRREPSTSTRHLMRLMEANPEMLQQLLKERT